MSRRGRFAAIAGLGLLVLVLGFVLLHSFHAHLLAYLLLAAGNAALIGGSADILAAQPSARVALSYGTVALGIVILAVGVNYLTFPQYVVRGVGVIGIGTMFGIGGLVGALTRERPITLAAWMSAILLGGIASVGVIALIVGGGFLVAPVYPQDALLALGIGATCLLTGVGGTLLVRAKAGQRFSPTTGDPDRDLGAEARQTTSGDD